LAGVSVEIDGTTAGLLYVSPQQINFLVPAGTDLGTDDVLVRSSPQGLQFKGSMQVRIVAPALFSKDASGHGPGAILNAVTFSGEPFLVETVQNHGNDKRTRLAVFATGLRYAGNLSQNPAQTNVAIQIRARDTAGNSYNVEYAGSAPGFFGLDQINLILPAQVDGAGNISLAIAAGDSLSNTVTFNVASLPDSDVHLSSLTLSPTSIIAGNDVSGTVSLNARARFGGYNVSLATSGLGVQTPLSIRVPEGQTSAAFTVHTSSLATGTVTVTASSGSFSQTANLQIYPVNTPQLTGITLSAAAILGGASLTGTLSLSGQVGLGGAIVQLASSNDVVQAPSTVNLSFGDSSASFSVTTANVTSQQSATITATFANSTASVTLLVNPALALTLSQAAVTGGNPVTGTVSLAAAPSTNATVNLKSSDPLFAATPLSVIVPAGRASASFTIPTTNVISSRTIVITASYGAASESAALTINPAGLPTLVSLTLSPAIVQGGNNSTGTVTLTGPAPSGGLLVDLLSGNPFVARVSPFVMVPAGQNSATFTIATTSVSSTQTVTITASAGGVSQSATLTVQ
jgi:uncharacterized protein (TIGR03437 family)